MAESLADFRYRHARNFGRSKRLVAVPVQGLANALFHANSNGRCTAQVASSLGRNGLCQVAGTAAAMLCMTLRGQTETLLRSLMRLHFRFAFGHRSDSVRAVRVLIRR